MESKTTEERPSGGKFLGFDHCHFWVGNAKQAASWYTSRMGFDYYAFRGLQTGFREFATHVVQNREGTVFAFSSPYTKECQEMGEHISNHGDGVKDVAFRVENAIAIYEQAISRGAISVQGPQELKDENGSVIIASVKTYGDTIHTFIQRNDYKGLFMPGFIKHPSKEIINEKMEKINYNFIDHIVGNQPDNEMVPIAEWYEQKLDFQRFWSVDDKMIHTDYSSLRSIVVCDFDEIVKMPINQPANGKRISQIQEYVDYYGGAGVQHIALNTSDILSTVNNLKQRGVEFLSIPDTYYDNLRKNIPSMSFKIQEDIDMIQQNQILVDYDDKGYLLQIFTKPVQDRPTLFYEIIQRNNHTGFGAGNFQALFVSLEGEQEQRGNLYEQK